MQRNDGIEIYWGMSLIVVTEAVLMILLDIATNLIQFSLINKLNVL